MTGPAVAMQEILDGIDAIEIDPAAKHKFRELVCAVGRRNRVKAITIRERQAFAADLLAKGTGRREIRSRLESTFEISERQAIRIIGEMLDKPAKDVQKMADTPRKLSLIGGECLSLPPPTFKRRNTMEIGSQRKWMTRAEVATFLRLDARTVSTLALPAVRLGRQYRYDTRDVEALLENKVAPTMGAAAGLRMKAKHNG